LHSAPGSAAFDPEGVATRNRDLVRNGVLQTYLLGSYAARKLDMRSTGHAGGAHNVMVRSDNSTDFEGMLKRMGTGLLVTELMGQGINLVTGDYSRGAAGFWIREGEIQHPVSGVTIAGNLKDMLTGIEAIGDDVDRRGNIQTGAILVGKMIIAGA
jgi:PmbA protein